MLLNTSVGLDIVECVEEIEGYPTIIKFITILAGEKEVIILTDVII